MTGPGNQPLFEANGCLQMAGNRLQDARALLNDDNGTNQGCCFFSHQTAEMSLKGLIWYYTEKTPQRAHSLRLLIQELEQTSFNNHPDYDSMTSKTSILERHYIGSRYAYEDDHGNIVGDYTRREAEDSVAAATHIYEVARSVVPPWEPDSESG